WSVARLRVPPTTLRADFFRAFPLRLCAWLRALTDVLDIGPWLLLYTRTRKGITPMILRTVSVSIGLLVVARELGCKKEDAPTGTQTAAASSAAGDKKGGTVTIWWAQWAPSDGLQELGLDYEKESGVAGKVHHSAWSNYQDRVFLNFGQKTPSFHIVVGDSQWLGRG